jgi:hypothetical protein
MQLEFLHKNTYSGYGGDIHKLKPIKDLRPELVTINDALDQNCRTIISTQCTQKFWSDNLHVLAVDCDSVEAKDKAVNQLSLQYAVDVVESSPEHFWVITDQVGTWKETALSLQRVDGADKDFVSISLAHQKITFRAFPKQIDFSQIHAYPRMGTKVFHAGLSRDWLTLFRAYYTSKSFRALAAIILSARTCRTCDMPSTGIYCPRCGNKVDKMSESEEWAKEAGVQAGAFR